MAVEIERKFLVDERPAWLDDCSSRRIEQGYLALSEEAEVRLRLIDGGREAKLTVKRGGGRVREETEIELIADQAQGLWPATEGRRVSKRRFRTERESGVYEIDVYEDELDGLVTCEVEFASAGEADRFEPPGWVGTEVTEDHRYKNRALATDGLPEGTARD